MTFITADRIKETTTVTGTGPITLLGAVSGYRSFASVMQSFGDTCPYAIVNADASQWEVGIATYTDDNTLTRTTIHASTADPNTEPVDFAAGVKDVFLAPTARTVLSDLTSNDGTVTLAKVGSVVDLSVAIAAATENVVVQVRNNTGATLTKGTVVYINDALGQLPTVAKALATSDATSAQTLGMISADLDNNSNGYVTIIGLIDDISLDTGIYSDGDQLYLSGTTAGAFTNVKPYAPTHLVYVGVVEHAHNVHGKIFVKVQNGYELDELHDVSAQNPSNGQTIVYNSTNQLWENNTVSLTAGVNGTLPVTNGGTGVTTATGTGSVVLSTAPTLTTATFAAGTISASTPNTITQTWNNAAVTFSALTINVTNNASAAYARILDCYVGASNVAFITRAGSISCTNMFSVDARIGGSLTSNTWRASLSANGTGELLLASTGYIGFTSIAGPADLRGYIDAVIIRDAANTIAQRNGTNPQAFRIYNTYTSASVYERASLSWASNVCTLTTESTTAGAGRNLVVSAGNGVTTGAGGNVTITAGNGSGVGAGGNIILQPGAQGTSGGNGIVQCTKKLEFYTGSSKTDLAFQINNSTTGMWYHSGANMFVWTINNTDTICFRQGYIRLSKGGGIYWSNTTNDAITLNDDTSIYSASRGVFAVDAPMQSVNSQGGSLAYRSFTTNQAANVNDWVMGPSAFQRVNCTTASSITGIAPYTSGVHVDGRMIRIYNVGNANLTLSHNSASSTTGNKFFNSTGADIILAPNDYAELIWDGTNNGSGSSGWRVA